MLLGFGNKFDDLLGTLGRAGSAAHALLPVYHSHAVYYVNRVKGTGLYAQTAGNTAIFADLTSLIIQHGRIVITLTFYKGLLALGSRHIGNLNAYNLGNFSRAGRSAYGTGIHRRLALKDRFGQAVAAGITAAAAVVAGQAGTDRLLLFIDLHSENIAGHTQKQADNQTNAAYHQSGVHYILKTDR